MNDPGGRVDDGPSSRNVQNWAGQNIRNIDNLIAGKQCPDQNSDSIGVDLKVNSFVELQHVC
jgi:hypothetical protein